MTDKDSNRSTVKSEGATRRPEIELGTSEKRPESKFRAHSNEE